MPLPVAAYAPHGNAQLTFKVAGGPAIEDPATGNQVPALETLEYLAALKLSRPDHREGSGVDQTLYQATGRLLEPAVLDARITNGSQAAAIINGYRGRFELDFDLAQDDSSYPVVRQTLQGTFRVIGGKAHG